MTANENMASPKRFSKDKHSSLFCGKAVVKKKKFYNIDTRKTGLWPPLSAKSSGTTA
jgi:hypothetical protein